MTALASPPASAPVERRAPPQHRVAYVVAKYPAVSHTFIQREVRALRELGTSVDVFSIHAASKTELLAEADRAEADATTTIFPLRVVPFVRAHVELFSRSPRTYFSTLRYAVAHAPRGLRARVWQVFYFAEAVMVWSHCSRSGIRHLHAHLANVAADVAWLACELGRGVDRDHSWHWSFTMHGCVEFWEVNRFNLGRKVAAADLVVCISDFTRAQLMAFCALEHWSKLRVVHCGVELDRYRPRATHETARDSVEILAVGRLSPEKGHFVLLEAFAELRPQERSVHLTIVGDGPLRAELVAHARRLGVDVAVTFAGAVGQDEMPEIFRRADIFCQPSFNEGIPVVLMEAMASGLPVVSSKVAGIPELVDDGRAGVLVPPGRVDALATALRRLVDAPALRQAMGRVGHEKVARSFDADAGAREVARLFAEMTTREVPCPHEEGPCRMKVETETRRDSA